MLLGFGYLYKFVMYYFFFFPKKQEAIDYKKPVVQNFVILFFGFCIK